jgi:hypothetical protein
MEAPPFPHGGASFFLGYPAPPLAQPQVHRPGLLLPCRLNRSVTRNVARANKSFLLFGWAHFVVQPGVLLSQAQPALDITAPNRRCPYGTGTVVR